MQLIHDDGNRACLCLKLTLYIRGGDSSRSNSGSSNSSDGSSSGGGSSNSSKRLVSHPDPPSPSHCDY